MKTCSLLLLLVAFSSCLSAAANAEVKPDVRRYSLKYVTAEAALRTAFETLSTYVNGKPPGLEDDQPVPLKVSVGSTKLTSNPRTNALTVVSADAVHLELLEKLLKAIDTKPTTIQVSAILLEVSLGKDTRHATDVLDLVDSVTIDEIKVNPKKISAAPHLNNEQREKAFAAYADALGELEQCNVLARPSIFVRDNDEGTLRIGNDDQGTHLSVSPRAHPDKTIELTIEWNDLTNKQTLETSVHVPNLEVTVLGGLVREDNGAKKERMILLQPAIR